MSGHASLVRHLASVRHGGKDASVSLIILCELLPCNCVEFVILFFVFMCHHLSWSLLWCLWVYVMLYCLLCYGKIQE